MKLQEREGERGKEMRGRREEEIEKGTDGQKASTRADKWKKRDNE